MARPNPLLCRMASREQEKIEHKVALQQAAAQHMELARRQHAEAGKAKEQVKSAAAQRQALLQQLDSLQQKSDALKAALDAAHQERDQLAAALEVGTFSAAGGISARCLILTCWLHSTTFQSCWAAVGAPQQLWNLSAMLHPCLLAARLHFHSCWAAVVHQQGI